MATSLCLWDFINKCSLLLGLLYGREKLSLLDIQWIIHSSQDQASLLDNKMPCMSNWWANGCPAEHSKLTAQSTIRFLSPFSSKHASPPSPYPVCANTCRIWKQLWSEGRGAPVLLQLSTACWPFPWEVLQRGSRQQLRATTCTEACREAFLAAHNCLITDVFAIKD